MIKEIELINFRSHEKTKLKFEEGNNIFVGISGSGKSSVLDAICFGLYGTIPKIQKRKIKISELIRNKPALQDSAFVRVCFVVDEKNYEVIRELYLDRSSTAELREEGRLIAVNPAQVGEAITNLLKIDYDLFSQVIYAEQNNIDHFLNLPPGNRMSSIDELLKLSKFETIRSRTISIANKFKNQKEVKESILSNFDETRIREEKLEQEKYLGGQEGALDALDKQISSYEKESLIKGKILFDLEEKKKLNESLRKKIIELSTQVSIFETELKEVPEGELAETERELSDLKKQLENLELEERERELAISRFETKLKLIEENIEEKIQAEKFVKEFDLIEFNKSKGELYDLERTLLEKEVHKKSLQSAISGLESPTKTCPTCDQKITEERRNILLENKKIEANELELEMTAIKKEISAKKQRLEELKSDFEKFELLDKRLSLWKNLESEENQLKKEVSSLKEERKELGPLRKRYFGLSELCEKLKNYNSKKKKLSELKKELFSAESEMKKVFFDETELEEFVKEMNKIKLKLTEFGLEREYKQNQIRDRKQILAKIEKDLEIIEKTKQELAFFDYSHQTLTNFSDTLIEVQELLRSEFVETLNEVMNEIWEYVYPYEDYVGIRFRIESRDYLLQLCDLRNNWINVEGFSSGGERAIASLVMRIALAIVLAPKMKLLILDEPTHNLDSNTIKKLTEILRTKVVEFLEQIFIVTHDERLIQAGTAYVYEFLRKSSKKEPTEVRELKEKDLFG